MFMDSNTRETYFLFCRQAFYVFLNSGICDSGSSHMFIRSQVVSGCAKTLSFGNSRGQSSFGTHRFSWILKLWMSDSQDKIKKKKEKTIYRLQIESEVLKSHVSNADPDQNKPSV